MVILEEKEAAKTLAGKSAGLENELENKGFGKEGLEGEGSNTVMLFNRRLVVTETTVEMRTLGQNGMGSDQDGPEDIVKEKGSNSVSVERGEFTGNGTAIGVDVKGSLDGENENDVEKKIGNQGGDGSYSENGVNPDEKLGKLDGSVSITGEKSCVTEEKRGQSSVIENQEKVNGGIGLNEMHKFSVGDFVWGKIKSHPWWPGQIYDPSDASEFASHFKHDDRVLVAYFGDGSCSWCFPSQLVPFTEHFEEMSKQSTSKSFVNAVDKALEEIGRRAEVRMTCSCVPEENRAGLARPESMNAGVRPGVLVPEGDIGKLAAPMHEPAEVLEYVRHLAQAGSVINMLELVFVKSWLSAFYCVRMGSRLPMYHEPQQIEGLEDKSENVALDANDFSVPIEVPIQGPLEEESPSSRKAGTGKSPMLPDEKLNQRRKHKSVAELMGDDKDVKPKRKKSKSGEETPSTTVKKKKRAHSEAINVKGILQASTPESKRGRKKKAEISTFLETAVNNSAQLEREVNEIPSSTEVKKGTLQASTPESKRGRKKKAEISTFSETAVNNSAQLEREVNEIPSSTEVKKGTLQACTTESKRGRKKKAEISTFSETAVNNSAQLERVPLSTEVKKNQHSGVGIDGNAKDESEKSLMSRERKKSKYLSPPYTTPSQKGGKSSSKKQLETELEKIIMDARVGERMSKAAAQLIVSPPISKCNSATSDGKMSEGQPSGLEVSGVSPHTVKQKEKKIIDSTDVSASVKEVLKEVQCAGVDLMSLENNSMEMIKGFIFAFRSSIYLNGSNYKSYNKQKAGRKRKSSFSESGNVGNDQNQTSSASPQPLAQNEKIDRPRSRVTKLKKAAREGATNKKEVDRKASLVSLIVSFPPGSSLPSKDEIIKTFSNYGKLKEDEIEVLRDSNCAQVAYSSISDAEKAFKEAIKQSPFGASKVDYSLQYSSAASRALDSGKKIPTSPKKRTLKNPVGSQTTDDEISQVGLIKREIKMLTTVLETCNGKVSAEEKSSLEGELRSLLQKVSALAVKTSS